VPYLRAANVRWGGLDVSDVKTMQFSPDEVETFRLQRDDILVVEASGSRDEVGKSALWREELPLVCLQNTLIRVRSRGVDPSFLRWHLHLDASSGDLGSASKGIGIHHIGAGRLAAWMINVPPLNEQRRIVAKLDAIFEQTRAAKARLERLPTLLDKLKRSILAAAFRGDLTADWRAAHPDVEPASKLLERIRTERRRRWEESLRAKGRNARRASHDAGEAVDEEPQSAIPSTWSWCLLGEAFSVQVGSTPSRAEPSYWGGDIPWVSSGEVAFCRISSTKEHITASGLKNSSTKLQPPGTVLVGMIGEGRTRGQPAILDIAACTNQNAAAVRVSETEIVPEYVYFHFAYRYEENRRVGSGNNQQALNKARVEAMPLPLAPVEEEREIARRLTEAFAIIDGLATRLNVAIEHATTLERSALAKAFRGELVEQDPNDEPASVLLERIRAARAQDDEPAARPRGRRARARAEAAPATMAEVSTDDNAGVQGEQSAPAAATHVGQPADGPPAVLRALDGDDAMRVVFETLWLGGAYDKDRALRNIALALRTRGFLRFHKLRTDGALYKAVVKLVDRAVKAGVLDRPMRGTLRACKPDASAYTADDWRGALLRSLSAEPVDRDEAIRGAAEWAREHLGLAFARLRSDGHIAEGLRSAINSGVRSGWVVRHGAKQISRVPYEPDRRIVITATSHPVDLGHEAYPLYDEIIAQRPTSLGALRALTVGHFKHFKRDDEAFMQELVYMWEQGLLKLDDDDPARAARKPVVPAAPAVERNDEPLTLDGAESVLVLQLPELDALAALDLIMPALAGALPTVAPPIGAAQWRFFLGLDKPHTERRSTWLGVSRSVPAPAVDLLQRLLEAGLQQRIGREHAVVAAHDLHPLLVVTADAVATPSRGSLVLEGDHLAELSAPRIVQRPIVVDAHRTNANRSLLDGLLGK
jgi:type I restriction enzyme S subunit